MKTFAIVVWLGGFLYVNSVLAAPIVDNWRVVHEAFFKQREVADAGDQLQITAPEQAENAALVPFAFALDAKHDISKIHLFTDANPILHTATFHFPPNTRQFSLATRIRLENNSQVRLIAESVDGSLMMKTVVLKTPGGGCGGGGYSDEAALRASAGQMKLKFVEGADRVAFNIKHPMRTGFERTPQGYFAKAWFINTLDFRVGDTKHLRVDVGPGISADPYFQFSTHGVAQAIWQVEASDNEGKQFSQQFTLGNSP